MKEQTLEEFINSQPYYGHGTPEYLEGIEVGAKWQQKKMFTEEQLAMAMLDFGLYIAENRGKPIDTDNKIKEIIEQFKQQEQVKEELTDDKISESFFKPVLGEPIWNITNRTTKQEEPKSYIEYTNTDDFTSMIYNPQEKLKQSVQEYEQQGLEKYSYELEKTRTMKTAVEWLYDNLKSHFEHDGDLLEVVQFSFKQAKEMEKEKAIKFVKHCLDKAKDLDIITAFMNVEEYYETFKQQEK
jgi:hypothetical protein